MENANVDAYLARINAKRSDSLAELQEKHLAAVPFENLSIHLGEPIVLEPGLLVEKIVGRRRGGFCYELNGAFAELLRALGYDVTMLAARAFTPAGLGPPFDHMCLLVRDGDVPWLVDVGFGRFASRPLRLDIDEDQADPAGVFRVVRAAEDDLDVLMDGTPQYRIELRPRALEEFNATCWYQQTFPTSHFRAAVTCSRVDGAGRVTISGNKLILTRDGERVERFLDDDALLAAYAEHFGIHLDHVPTVVS